MERIAFISVHGCPSAKLGSKDTGGMNVYIRQIARELGKRGVYVDVYTRYHDSKDPQIVRIGKRARVIHIKAGPFSYIKEDLPNYLPEFVGGLLNYAEIKGLSYDMVHSHYWLSGRIGTVLAHRWGVPHVTSFHTLAEIKRSARIGEREPETRVVGERKVLASVDRTVAFSEHEREAIVRLYNARGHNIDVIPCGVDVGLFRPMNQSRAKKKLGLEGSKVVLYVGRIEPIKGVDILLGAVAQLEHRDLVKTLIVGGEPDGDAEIGRLEAMSRELGISSQVSFLGRVEQKELPVYYNAADVCVVPSYYESFGLVALEAMACGVPVVASRVGGLASVVKGGVTGYLIPWRCPEPFADCLDVLLNNPVMRDAMGKASRSLALTMQWSAVADSLMDLYDSLMAPPLAEAAAS
jgi:D-inositol-3-phosphate glycosyltransferase